MEIRRFYATASVLACALLLSHTATAQSYPSKPVRLVVPFAAGGTVDTVARVLGQKFTELWSQPLVIENRAGAGGNIGADGVAKAAPDGYTLLLTTHGHAISPGLYRKLPFDALKDFTPISQLSSSHLILVTHPRLPPTLKDVIALAKAQPGKLNFGSSGLGAPPHLAGELLRSLAEVDLMHVPYKGDAPLMPALLAGEVQLAFVPVTAGMPLVKSGKLRLLAMSGPKRSSLLPDVPTVMEAGVPNFEMVGWMGFFAPAGTPREIATRISTDAARVLRMPDIVEKLPGWGYIAIGSTPEEFTVRYREDIAKYARLIKQAAIPLID